MTSEIDFKTIKAVLRKAHEKLVTARIDFENDRYDDSVSRAYYAIFHSISAVLLSKGLHYSKHSRVIGQFNKEFIKTGIFPSHFTKIIHQLFEGRQTSDYDVDSYISKEEADEYLKNTELLINECRKYLTEIGMPENDDA